MSDFDIGLSDTLPGKKVLIVEDSDADILLLREALEKAWPANQALTVRSIKAAYMALKKYSFDLICLDLNLPDGLGPHTVKEMRQFDAKVPIIVITSMGTDLTMKEALKNGANHALLKSNIFQPEFQDILKQYEDQH